MSDGNKKPVKAGSGPAATPVPDSQDDAATKASKGPAGEPERPDPTRYGDWEKNGRCIDF
ncbi:MAG: DUF1674 domain-containing protein [Rhodospirillales bacterium]